MWIYWFSMVHKWYTQQLEQLRRDGLYRQMRTMESGPGRLMQVGGEEKLVFCSNNYLGLAGHPRMIAAIKQGLDQWGFGSGGARLICGNSRACERLQMRLAEMLRKEASVIFPSGYAVNNAVLSTLPQDGDLIAVDKLVHASIIDGAQAGRAQMRTWPHRNLDKLKRLLDRGGYQRVFIVTDSLFSMDGDIADLEGLIELKRQFDAVLMVDEAHAFGCMGPGGCGCGEQGGGLDDIDIFVGTFSKALGGSGGFVGCSQVMFDYLVNKSRGFIFTTGIPAINCIAAEAALDIIADEPGRRQRLLDNGVYFRRRCQEMDLDIGVTQSYIVPIMLGLADKAVAAANELWDRGFMVSAIRPPTVAPGSARLRVSLMSEHTHEDIDGLCGELERIVG